MGQDISELTPGLIGQPVPVAHSLSDTPIPADRTRMLFRLLLLIGSLALMFVGELGIYDQRPGANINDGLNQIAVGLVLVLINAGSLFLQQIDPFWKTRGKEIVVGEERVRIRLGWLAIGLLLIGYLCNLEVARPVQSNFYEYILLWLLGIVALALSILPDKAHATQIPNDYPMLRWEYVALLLLLVAGLATRVIDLGHMPYLFDQDEAAVVREGTASALVYHFQASPFEAGAFSLPMLGPQLTGVAVLLFGQTLFAARIVYAVCGALTIPALYLFGRELFNRQVGLVAALFMLGWAYHNQFSRLALLLPGDLLFDTLACYFLLQGLRRHTSISYFLAAACLATARLFHLGSLLVVILFIVYLVYLFIRDWRSMRSQWRQIGILVASFFIITLPQHYDLLYFRAPVTVLFRNESVIFGPLQEAIQRGTGPAFVYNQLYLAVGALFTIQDYGWYGNGSNLMGWIGGPLLAIGFVGLALVFWKRPRWTLPLIWIAGVTTGGAALQTSPNSYERFFSGASALALIVAAGVWFISLGVASILQRPGLTKRLLPILGVTISIAGLAFFVYAYVPARKYFNNYQNWLTNRLADETVQAYTSGRYPIIVAGFQSGLLNTVVVQYYMTGRAFMYMQDETTLVQAFQNTDPSTGIDFNKPLTFIVAPTRMADLLTLEKMYPKGRLREKIIPESNTLGFYIFEVDQSQI